MEKLTRKQVVNEFKGCFADELKTLRGDKIAKNELFWNWADAMCKEGYISNAQFNRWSSPF